MSKEMKEVKDLVQGTLLGKYPCSECGSNDNLLVYVKHNDNGEEVVDGSCRTPSCKSFWTEKELKDANVLDENFVASKVKPIVKTAIKKTKHKGKEALFVPLHWVRDLRIYNQSLRPVS